MAAVRWAVDDNHNVKEIHKVVVHSFTVNGGVDDPDVYAADPLWKWQESDPGKFITEHAIEKPSWHRQMDYINNGYSYVIIAELELKKLSEFYLKWGNDVGNIPR
jgi:hypothetical protein